MMSRYARVIQDLLRQSWVRIVGFALLALLAAVMARVLSPLLPESLVLRTGTDAVAELLRILTQSMLAVTTFSLSIAVAAFASAARTATPRATVLLQQDRTTQNVLATFLGAFVFGLVGLIALRARVYDAAGRLIVFVFTVAVITLVVVALIRWIGHLVEFGRMGDTLDRVEAAATEALRVRRQHPHLGGQPLQGAPPPGAVTVAAARTGHVTHVAMQQLQDLADALDARFYVQAQPGAFVAPGAPLLLVEAGRSCEQEQVEAMRAAFQIGPRREFDDDPRFGLIVLTEIASRALSPAINDPGTAIDIVGRHVRILSHWRVSASGEVPHARVFVPPLALDDAVFDAFRPIARDAARFFELQIRLQKALALLRQMAPELYGASCDRMAREALTRAEKAGLLPAELDAVRAAAAEGVRTG